uniref:Hydantoinase/oxoprolinase family protein n=1 Tax=Thermorudis peleae TaxID=1382356 RepID=A0A831X251_9BACT
MRIVGVDTGGTFTDFVLFEDGRVRVHKVLSTPTDPARAILQGLADLGIDRTVDVVVHGSTVATNAVLEHKGARTGLITTAGFRDVLEIGRQNRPKLYDLRQQKPPPLVPRELRLEVTERLDERGGVLVPLDQESVRAAIDRLQQAGVESVAVCLLFSFANPEHERIVAEAAERAGFFVSASHVVLPEFREYERTSTVALNAYVGPLMARYLSRLEQSLPRQTTVRIMQSNGGTISAATAGREAARTLLSGPAAGVVGAAYVAEASGFRRVISFDMGGTSTDVSLIDGAPTQTTEGKIGPYPMRLPMLDIHTVGAGGGSIAWFDAGGALRVGPVSAGADPGPAAYGRGGSEPTVSDANVVLGRLVPDAFLGGTMRLDAERARLAVGKIAERLGSAPEAAALGIVQIANANMEAAIRVISVERGYDPRDFTLVAFGGAGPLHACELAERLRIPRVLVPTTPGVLSALGMLATDIVKDYARTVMLRPGGPLDQIEPAFGELEERARVELGAEGIAPDAMRLDRFLDLRYVGQSYELTVPFQGDVAGTVAAFHRAHERRYGYADSAEPVEVVNVRLRATGLISKPALERQPEPSPWRPEPSEKRPVTFDQAGEPMTCTAALYQRDRLGPGAVIAGPAIVTQYDTTTVLPPGWDARVDAVGNLIAERDTTGRESDDAR